MTWHEDTFFERMIRRVVQLPWWLNTALLLGLAALPIVVAYLEQVTPVYVVRADWRAVVFPTAGIAYIVAVAPAIWRAERAVVEGLRPLAECQSPATRGTWRHSSRSEWIAFGLGVLGGVLLIIEANFSQPLSWADRYIIATGVAMYGALVWLIYTALSSAHLTTQLHRTLRPHNPFDLSPFEPVGHQALVLALIFVGAITLSLIFLYTPKLFFDWVSLLIYAVLILTTLSVFFGVMWPAHRTMARVKADEQASLQRLIAQTYAQLRTDLREGVVPRPISPEIESWLAFAMRLERTPTWPYNVVMLRTLVLSVLTPMFVALFRVVGLWLSEGHL